MLELICSEIALFLFLITEKLHKSLPHISARVPIVKFFIALRFSRFTNWNNLMRMLFYWHSLQFVQWTTVLNDEKTHVSLKNAKAFTFENFNISWLDKIFILFKLFHLNYFRRTKIIFFVQIIFSSKHWRKCIKKIHKLNYCIKIYIFR